MSVRPAGHPLRFTRFGPSDPLSRLRDPPAPPRLWQRKYLQQYLTDLGATTVVEEPEYFDSDFLAAYAAFYATTAVARSNRCRRLLFFGGKDVERRFRAAIRGSERSAEELERDFLGFCVVRPLEHAPLGRTVLRWYEDRARPERVRCARTYHVHVAGLTLSVEGLAWQQQDGGVAA